jgi:hypothetical protein
MSSRYKIARPPRGEPKPVCPWCGSNGYAQHYRLVKGRPRIRSFRVAKRKVEINHSVKSLGRYGIAANGRPYMRGAASRTTAHCAHPFHEQFAYRPVETPAPRPPRAHNPDLADLKKAVKRALQGKDRR